MRQYQLVIFDWDGTLMDSTARIVATVERAIGASGLEPRSPAQIRSIIGLGLREAIDVLYPDAPAAAREALTQHYRGSFAHGSRAQPAALFPGAAALLERLRQAGLLLAVATGKSRAGLRRELGQTGIGHHFAALRTVDECPSKPHPAMVAELVEECGVAAPETLVVGDTLFDLEMAANAGVDAVGVSWGAHSEAQLKAAGPRAVVQDFNEIGRWLASAGRAG